MKAMIFAAGLGTRLKPLTDRMPKALVPVAGKPLIQHVTEKLAHAGFNDFVVNVHHFATMIDTWCQNAQMRSNNGMNFHISHEHPEPLETGGGIKHAAPLLQDADRFLIHNVDILSNVDLDAFWQAGGADEATLLVSERETQRYLIFDMDMRLVGWTNVKTGEVRTPFPAVREAFDSHYSAPVNAYSVLTSPFLKPEGSGPYQLLAFAGIHQMKTSLLPAMQTWPQKFSIIDFYLGICDQVVIRGYVQPGLRLLDVGKLDTLEQAETFVEVKNEK